MADEAGNARLVVQIQATLGQTLAAAGDYAAALPLMDGALAAKQRGAHKGGSVAVGSAFTLASKGGLLGDRGDFIEAQARFDDAMALAGDSTAPDRQLDPELGDGGSGLARALVRAGGHECRKCQKGARHTGPAAACHQPRL